VTARLFSSKRRPYIVLLLLIVFLAIVDREQGRFINVATAFSTLQAFSTFGLVALGLGLTMVIGEFDLSVAGVFGLAGCLGLLAGSDRPWLGIFVALAVGGVFGTVQGLAITKLRVGSVPVSLGALLTASGLAFVVTGNRTVSSDNIDLAMAFNDPVLEIFSIRSLVVLSIFIVAALLFSATLLGRDLVATGSDRKAAEIAGVPVGRLVLGAFIFSGVMSALGGVMLSYGLASASPSGLSDVLVPSAAAAILGGVSLAGGTGTPSGIAAGVLTLTVLRSGLTALAAPPFANYVATGLILFAVAVSDAPYLMNVIEAYVINLRRAG
jgi:ribose transport system permease protein